MSAILSVIIRYATMVLPALPQIISGIESLWKWTPKSGAQKWIAVEQALSQSISMVAQEVAQVAPATSDTKAISAAVAIFTKSVNDAFVKLANDLGVFPHS
jgi:predicted PurR-regulated permease PerM